MEHTEHQTTAVADAQPPAEHVERLQAVLAHSREARATKNVNEHLNCTKQGCFSGWT